MNAVIWPRSDSALSSRSCRSVPFGGASNGPLNCLSPSQKSDFDEARAALLNGKGESTDIVNQYSDSIYPDALDSVRYQGKYWGAPWAMTIANLMYYNEDILKKNNIDPKSLRTWSSFTKACEKIKRTGVTPIAIGAKNAWPGGHWAQHLFIRTFGVKGSVDLFM